MLEIFKKKDTTNVAVSATKPLDNPINQQNSVQNNLIATKTVDNKTESVFDPPKNLPDLAKDLFGIDQGTDKTKLELEAYAASQKNTSGQASRLTTRMPIEPTSISVPKLDINLIKDRSADKTVETKHAVVSSNTVAQMPDADLRLMIEKAIAEYLESMNTAGYRPQTSAVMNPSFRNIIPHNYDASNELAARGKNFFGEFERYILQGTANEKINKSVINELLSSNLLDKMRKYHDENTKALASQFAELEDLEKLWMISMERSKSANMLNEYLESDILFKSENIKKSLAGTETTKTYAPKVMVQNQEHSKKIPFDIFQILRKKNDNQKLGILAETSAIAADNISVKDEDSITATSYDTSALSFEKQVISSIVITDPSKYFYVSDGVVVRSLQELISALARMSDATFNYHVTQQRNDFANWIRGIFNMHELADAAMRINSRTELLNLLAKMVI